ncbi:hypothetical protein LINPERPRIM_LOCUS36565 [Linum perenne]
MASSTLTGDRRFSTRRSGMTVLGKVAVPKPINLPSQRGTHSWGSKSSSSSSNAWGSSTLSPSDGGTGSPSYLSGRPSSGGSGTRPSTAGSDRGSEPIANAWNSNSRPSSASGSVTSNRPLLSTSRPLSAETRPGSSQLSRFAEPLSDNTVPWGSLGTAERLGVPSSKSNGFSLTSGDFPTLGSEKENFEKNTDLPEHGYLCDSPSGGAPVEEMRADAVGEDYGTVDVKNDDANAWRREGSFYVKEGVRPNVEKWHPDPHSYPNSTIPQHFDPWHGRPVNNHPGGVWYRGPPVGPPFGSPVGPGGYPMEPFPYYRPQMHPGAQPVPPPSAGPRGPHPKHGDVFRPPMHDGYLRPGMPIRPGFYPAPVPYDGYYGPPMAYNNVSERDVPYMGMAAGPAAYTRYPSQNAHESGNSHGRSSGFGTKGLVPEQVESGHPHDAQGPYKVLLKQRDGWEGKDAEQKWDDDKAANATHTGKGDQSRNSVLENGWRTDNLKRDEDVGTRRPLAEGRSGTVDHKSGAPVKQKSAGSGGNSNAAGGSVDKISEHAENGDPISESLSFSRDPSLIKKIEGLNAKARASDVIQDAKSVSSRDGQENDRNYGSIRINHPVNEAITGSSSMERPLTHGLSADCNDDQISGRDRSLDLTMTSGAALARRTNQGVHIRSDHRSKGRINAQDTDGWRRRPQVEESHDGVSSAHVSSVLHGQEFVSAEATEKSVPHHQGNDEESMLQSSEPNDSQAQRAKMRELARQRLKQREKEEEERTREQKAKALAKLEELNRRMQTGESSSKTHETMSSSSLLNKQEEMQSSVQPPVAVNASTDNSVIASNLVAEAHTDERIINRVEIPTPLSNEAQQVTAKNATEAPVVVHDPSNTRHLDSGAAAQSDDVLNNVAHDYEGKASKQKRVAYRQKQNSSSEKAATEASKTDTDMLLNPSLPHQSVDHDTASNPVSPIATSEVAAHPRRKNRSTRNKHKLEEASSTAALPSLTLKNTTVSEASNDNVKPKTPESVTVVSSVQPVSDCKGTSQHSEQHPTSPNEDGQIKVNNQWKPQHSRKMPRNPLANKGMDKFHGNDAVVWAPVRTHIKSERPDEGSKKSTVDPASLPVKSDQQVHNSTKNKRAEMERYVPKPVAKEMAQQGNTPHSVASTVQMPSDETVGRSESAPLGSKGSQTTFTLKFGSFPESENMEGKQSKTGKVHGSWHQRSSPELQASSSNLDGDSQKPIKSEQTQKLDSSTMKEQSGQNDEWSDGWNMPEAPDTAPALPSLKDQGGIGRGRRQPHKGHRGHNYDTVERKIGSGGNEKVNTHSSAVEPHQPGSLLTSKEYSGVGERSTSQWQPKSQSTSATNQRGTRPNDGMNAVPEATGRPNKKISTAVGVSVPPQTQEVAGGTTELYPDQSLPTDKGNNTEDFHQGARRERKAPFLKGHTRNPAEPAYASNADTRNDQYQSYSSGFRRGGNQNNQFNRDQEARGEWSRGERDNNRQHNVGGNRERQRNQGTHYEYQPVGQHNKSKGNNFDPPKDGSQTSGPRFRERVQNHPRRGGGSDFHGRQTSSSIRVDTTSTSTTTTNFD